MGCINSIAAASALPAGGGGGAGARKREVWSCQYCGANFDTYAAADHHEKYSCPCNGGSGDQAVVPDNVVRVACASCRKILKLQPASDGVIIVTCPHCQKTMNARFRGAMNSGGGLQLELPPWWLTQPSWGDRQIVDAPGQVELVQTLFDRTWKDIITRDRKDRKALPKRLVVESVQQNCNPRLWASYVQARSVISRWNGQSVPVLTSQIIADVGMPALGALDGTVNESYLFHGSDPDACVSICESDFFLHLAGTHAGTLYGPGIYFAECCSKSDEYASDAKPGSQFEGQQAMLLCRVVLGRVSYCADLHPNARVLTQHCVESGQYDSVLGDREKCRGTYKEFIVYNNDQVYPQYIVRYRREV